MKSFIKTQLAKGYVPYAIFSVFLAILFIFTVLPSLPDLNIEREGLSLSAELVVADTGGGDGVGDAGGAGGGGDAGGGSGDGIGGGGSGGSIGGISGGETGSDPSDGIGGGGSGAVGIGGDTGSGDGVGDPGPGCCGDGGDIGTGEPVGDTGSGDGVGDPGPGCCGDGGDDGVGDPVGDTGTGDGVGDPGPGCCDGPSDSTPDPVVTPDPTPTPEPAGPNLVPGTCVLTVSTPTLVRGEQGTLSWSTSNLTAVSINQGIGWVANSGSLSGSPASDTTYILTGLDGNGSTVTCSASVNVIEPVQPVLSCDSFTATPSTLTGSGSVVLNWATSNAANVSINNGVGTVASDGTRTVSVNNDTNYILTATRGGQSVTCSVSVDVRQDDEEEPVPVCDAFTVDRTSVRSGETVTLTWATSNTSNVSIDQGIGAVVSDGTRSVTINGDTTFVLTASRGSVTRTCQTRVTIQSDGGGGGGGGGGSNSPRCTLKASDTHIQSGDRVTLTWRNSNTNDIRLEDDRGRVIADSRKDKDIDEDRDSVTVRPTRDTEYTLTAFRGSKKRECTVEIDVDDISVTGVRSRDPLVAGISLSNVPYTGFDAGPFLTTVFYTLLALWALAVAYILVIRRESVFGMSLKGKDHAVPAAIMGAPYEPAISYPAAPLASIQSVLAPQIALNDLVGSSAPTNLPVGNMATPTAPRGYDAYYETGVFEDVAPVAGNGSLGLAESEDQAALSDGDLDVLEAHAHDAHVLMSTSALNFIMAQSSNQHERLGLVDMVIAAAKANFPKEDGWIVVNKERILALLA